MDFKSILDKKLEDPDLLSCIDLMRKSSNEAFDQIISAVYHQGKMDALDAIKTILTWKQIPGDTEHTS